MIRVLVANRKGHSEVELSPEEAERLIEAELGRYYIVDAETRKVVSPVELRENQVLMMLPIVGGG